MLNLFGCSNWNFSSFFELKLNKSLEEQCFLWGFSQGWVAKENKKSKLYFVVSLSRDYLRLSKMLCFQNPDLKGGKCSDE